MGPPHARGADSSNAKESQLKAAFIFNFLKFAEWPAHRFSETNSPFVIGVIGTSPITAALEAAVKHRKINGRELIVKSMETVEAARAAHLLFVPATEERRSEDWLPTLASASILTVGESDAFATHGGMINFLLDDDRLRFDINIGSAEGAGLKVSAQLQKLARTVRRNPRE